MLRLCIPVHNEAPTIGVLLWRIRKVFQEFSREYDVTVFDDASSDGTAELLDPYRAVMPLTVLAAPRRVGYARAVDALVRHVAADDEYARRDAMVLLQGDFTDQPEQLPELIRRFEGGADVVAVARTTDEAMPRDERRLRRWGAWAVRPFVKLPAFDDPFGGYRLVRIAVLRDLLRAGGAAPVCQGDDPWAVNADFALTLAPFARRIENVVLPGRFDLRPRPSRHRAWPDTLALFRWARGARRVARPVPRGAPAGRDGARDRAASEPVPARAGTPEYAATTAPPPSLPPRPTRAEMAASEAPSRRPRRPTRDTEAASPREGAPQERAPQERAPRDGTRPAADRSASERARADRADRAAAGERSPRKGDDTAARGGAPSRRGEGRPSRGTARESTAAASSAGDDAEHGRRHLRRVAQHPHPHGDAAARDGSPTSHADEPRAGIAADAASLLDGPLVGAGTGDTDRGADAALADATVADGGAITDATAPARKKRRRRRKKRGAAGAAGTDAPATDEESDDASGDDGTDDAADEAGGGEPDEGGGDRAPTHAPVAGAGERGGATHGRHARRTVPAFAGRPQHRADDAAASAADSGAEGDDGADGGDDADDVLDRSVGDGPLTGDATVDGERRRRRRGRRRRRARPPEGGGGVGGSDVDGGAPAEAPSAPPAPPGD